MAQPERDGDEATKAIDVYTGKRPGLRFSHASGLQLGKGFHGQSRKKLKVGTLFDLPGLIECKLLVSIAVSLARSVNQSASRIQVLHLRGSGVAPTDNCRSCWEGVP